MEGEWEANDRSARETTERQVTKTTTMRSFIISIKDFEDFSINFWRVYTREGVKKSSNDEQQKNKLVQMNENVFSRKTAESSLVFI